MKLIERRAPRDFNLYLSGDKHYGTIMQHKSGIKKFVKMVRNDPKGYWVDMGDLAEGIAVDDPRYCIQTVSPNESVLTKQCHAWLDDHRPIFNKLWVVLEGNHTWKLGAKVGPVVRDMICKPIEDEIGLPLNSLYGTYSAKISISDTNGSLMFKTFLTHGAGALNSTADDPERRRANMKIALKRKLSRQMGDVVLSAMGHCHKLIVKKPISELYLTDDGKEIHHNYTTSSPIDKYIHPDLRWYCATGSFLKLYEMGVSGYAERAGYAPNELGFLIVKVRDGIIKGIKREVL